MFDYISVSKIFGKLFLLSFILTIMLNYFAYAQEIVKPDWLTNQTSSNMPGKKCFIGVSRDQKSRDEGLDSSYKNALSEIVKKEFPELITISERSSEGLKNSTYNREYVQQSDKIRWEGISEDILSPYVETINKTDEDTYNIYRRLCWTIEQIKNEKRRIKEYDKQLQSTSSKIDGLIPNGKTGEVGKLVVSSIPQGASVILDGEHIGRSNSKFENVVQGEYELILQLEGYEIQKSSIVVNKGTTTNINIKLIKIQSLINITSKQDATRIYLNNKPLGKVPIAIKLNALEKYQIRAELSDYETETKEVFLDYAAKEVNFDLALSPGQLSILSIPSGANISIDGATKGKTPLYSQRLPGGDHVVSFSMENFQSYEETVAVRKSRGKVISPRLVSIPEIELKKKKEAEAFKLVQEESDKKFAEEEKYINQQKRFWSIVKPAAIGSGLIGSGIIMLVYGNKYKKDANSNYTKYQSSKDPAEISSYKQKTNSLDDLSNILSWSGVSAILLGGTYMYFNFDF